MPGGNALDHEPLVAGPAAHLWTRTDLKPDDMQFAQLYDGFSFNCLTWLESLGFCGTGEAKDFLAGGENISLGGKLPLNTHGGQLSHGRTHGMGLVHEAIVQSALLSAERAIELAQAGIAAGPPGDAGSVRCLATSERKGASTIRARATSARSRPRRPSSTTSRTSRSSRSSSTTWGCSTRRRPRPAGRGWRHAQHRRSRLPGR